MYWSGPRDLYIDEAHTALDIFRFAAFLIGNIGSSILQTVKEIFWYKVNVKNFVRYIEYVYVFCAK